MTTQYNSVLILLALVVAVVIAPAARATPDAVEVARSFLLEQAFESGDEVRVEVFAPAARFPACAAPRAFLPPTQSLPPLGRVSVGLRCGDDGTARYLSARVAIIGDYLETAVDLAPGTTLEAAHLRHARGDLGALPPNALRDPDDVIGKITRRRLASSTTLQRHHLVDLPLIERGQQVSVESRGAGFLVRRTGEAMGNGALGERIRVRLSPREVVDGVVSGAGTVSAGR